MPHGVRGWVKLDLHGLDPTLLTERESWLLSLPEGEWETITPLATKVGAKGMLLALLEDSASRDAAELLRGRLVGVPRVELPQLPAGEYYWYDLIGLEVLDAEGEPLGRVRELIETGSNDVLLVDDGSRDGILLPYNETYVRKVDLGRSTISTSWRREY